MSFRPDQYHNFNGDTVCYDQKIRFLILYRIPDVTYSQKLHVPMNYRKSSSIHFFRKPYFSDLETAE